MKREQYLVLDLETVVDSTLPPLAKGKDGAEVFPPPPYHQIVVLGAALLDAYHRVRRIWIVGEGKGDSEFVMLAALVAFLNEQLVKRTSLTIVSFNGRGFDLPVIAARCLRHGLAFPWYYRQREVRSRYSPEGHLDVLDFLTDHGAGRAFSLDVAARLIGMPGKAGCAGGDVAAMIEQGQLEQVRAYCMSDVAQTTGLFLRTQLLRGELAPARYAVAMQGLLDAIGREPRLATMAAGLDGRRLLDVPGATATLPFELPQPVAAATEAA